MRAQQASTIDVFVALHRLHCSRSIIGRLTGYSSAFVGQILCNAGMRECWSNVDDVRADLPSALLAACDRLAVARALRSPSILAQRSRSPAGLNSGHPSNAVKGQAGSVSTAAVETRLRRSTW
jgi:hypothetical protein